MVSCSPSGVGVMLSSSWRCCCRLSCCCGAPQCLECRDGAGTQGQQMNRWPRLGEGRAGGNARQVLGPKLSSAPTCPVQLRPTLNCSGAFAPLG